MRSTRIDSTISAWPRRSGRTMPPTRRRRDRTCPAAGAPDNWRSSPRPPRRRGPGGVGLGPRHRNRCPRRRPSPDSKTLEPAQQDRVALGVGVKGRRVEDLSPFRPRRPAGGRLYPCQPLRTRGWFSCHDGSAFLLEPETCEPSSGGMGEVRGTLKGGNFGLASPRPTWQPTGVSREPARRPNGRIPSP